MARLLLLGATVLLVGCGAPGIGDQPVAVDPPPGGTPAPTPDAVFSNHPLARCDELPESPDTTAPSEHEQLQRELHERFPDPEQPPRVTGSGTGRTGRLEIGVVDPTREDLDAIAEVVEPERTCIEPERSGLPAEQDG